MRAVMLGLVFSLLAALPAGAAPSGVVARWLQYDAAGQPQARVAVSGAACPMIVVDGHARPMAERAPPSTAFPVRLCVASLPARARRISVLGEAMPRPTRAPARIVVFGDTGCRVLHRTVQDCRDPEAWPFARVARAAAAQHPDLVIHVGDYLYRETPCPAQAAGCAGSPSGDRWATWRADFFTPAAPLLETAPWILVRGNHEECHRAGHGWTRLLSAAPFPGGDACALNEPPYAVPMDGLRFIVFDDANAPDPTADAALVPTYRRDFARVVQLAQGPSWLLMHRPLRGILRLPSGQVTGGNATLLAARPVLPRAVALLLAGHIHAFEAINYAGGLPPQFIVGTGGDLLDQAPADLAGIAVGGARVTHGLSLPGFGFLLLTRQSAGQWHAEVFTPSGRVERRCRFAARRISCES